MKSTPAARPSQFPVRRARADGQRVEVRTYDGELVRVVPEGTASELVAAALADVVGDHLRLKLGIRWISPRDAKRASGKPNLDELQRREPEWYSAIWGRDHDPHIGRGALGRACIDRTVTFRSGGGKQ